MSRARRKIGPQYMQVEEFGTKDERDRRFQQLRQLRTPHVNKFTITRATGLRDAKGREMGRIIWFVVWR